MCTENIKNECYHVIWANFGSIYMIPTPKVRPVRKEQNLYKVLLEAGSAKTLLNETVVPKKSRAGRINETEQST